MGLFDFMKSKRPANVDGFKKNYRTFFMLMCLNYVTEGSKSGRPSEEMKSFLGSLQSIYRFYEGHTERARDELYTILHHMDGEKQKKAFGTNEVIYKTDDLSNVEEVMQKILNKCFHKQKTFDEYRVDIRETFSRNLSGRRYLKLSEADVNSLFDSLAKNYYKPSNVAKSPHSIFVNNLIIMSIKNTNNPDYVNSRKVLKALTDPKFYLRKNTGLHTLMRKREENLKSHLNKGGVSEGEVGRVSRNLGFEYDRLFQNKVFSPDLATSVMSNISGMIRKFAKMQYIFLILKERLLRKNRPSTNAPKSESK